MSCESRASVQHPGQRWACTHHHERNGETLHVGSWSDHASLIDSDLVAAIWADDDRMVEQKGGHEVQKAMYFKDALKMWDLAYVVVDEDELAAAIESAQRLLESMQ